MESKTMEDKRATPAIQSKDRIIWIDLEMTGLNVTEHRILEMACLITDNDLNIVSDEFEIIIHQSEPVFETMIPWAKEQHNKTGLIDASRKSVDNEDAAEKKLIKFLERYIPYNSCPLAGSCLYMDRAFLQKHMPNVFAYLGNEVIDVSSIHELTKRWNKKVEYRKQKKIGDHRALGDIKDSIELLKYYKNNIFN